MVRGAVAPPPHLARNHADQRGSLVVAHQPLWPLAPGPSRRRLNRAQNFLVIAFQREAARPTLARRLSDRRKTRGVASKQFDGTLRHVLAGARQQAGDTV